MISYAQNYEDVMLERLFGDVQNGFYIDIGAWDPTADSVTKHFYDRNWRGVNVEPIEARFRLFEKDRPRDINLCVAVADEPGNVTFFECVEESYLSTVDREAGEALSARGLTVLERVVPTVTLNEIFERHSPGIVDFLKIDVEGLEGRLLAPFDLRRFRPRVLVVESTMPAACPRSIKELDQIGTWHAWEPHVIDSGYQLGYFDGINRFYLREEDKDLTAWLRLPPSPYDRFETHVSRERMALIHRQAEQLVERDAVIQTLQGAADERLQLIGRLNEELASAKPPAQALKAARQEIKQLRAQAADFRDQLSQKERQLSDSQQAIKRHERQLAEARRLLTASVHPGGAAGPAVSRVAPESALVAKSGAIWQARQHARDLEAEIDTRRWRSWRASAFSFFATSGRRLAEGILCQVFPPLPPKKPLRVTIVTPVFNNVDTLRETILSVIGQTDVDLEYVVVDGGSTDGSLAIIDEYRDHIAHVISEPDEGMYDAIGKGFALGTGDIFSYLNADDLYEKGALSRVVEAFQEDTNRQVIYFEDTVTIEGWRFPNRAQKHVDFLTLFKGHILFQDGVFFRRRAYNYVGGINRTMRYAGDWELWVRLAYRFPFKRLVGHVSTFRVREGQLSQNMASYHAEVEEARARLAHGIPRVEFWLRYPRHLLNRIRNKLSALRMGLGGGRRLFFPMDFGEMPPPAGIAPDPASPGIGCAIEQQPPTELLFSSRDTRFGDRLINWIYYHRYSDIVSVFPALDREALKALYARTYNAKEPVVLLPEPGVGSPYRNYKARSPLLRWLAHLELPRMVRGAALRLGFFHWPDRSLEEIRHSIKGLLPSSVEKPSFLDVGCFDGKLLDRLASEGNWQTCGIEPNDAAAAIARNKSHTVWTTEVEDILAVLPEDMRFDVIFLGQTIEHFNDPLSAVIQLSQLLKPHGLMVLSTPNINSAQIDMFGPTWAHWHPPYHRYLFSPRSMGRLAEAAQLRLLRCRTFSHPSWSWLSQRLHRLGLGGAVPHGVVIAQDDIPGAESLAIISRLLYDWRGKGDYMYAVLGKNFSGR